MCLYSDGLMCVDTSPCVRPCMAEVVLLLAHAVLLQEPQELSCKECKKIAGSLGKEHCPAWQLEPLRATRALRSLS